MAEVFLRRLSRWQAEAQREAVADLYVEAYRGVSGEEFHDRQDFLQRFADHVQRPGFDMMVASDTRLVGCAYGFPPPRDGAWWRGIRGGIPEDMEELTASGRVFAIAEMMVLPSHRRGHAATRLQQGLLDRSDAALAAVLVETANVPARTAFQSWGWSKTGSIPPMGGHPEREVWSHSLNH